jgi:hypothetical protein
MSDNFLVAIERMRDSSRNLHGTSHFHNACYLGGYVVECYLKILYGLSTLNHAAGPRTYSHNLGALNADLIYNLTSSASTSRMRPYSIDIATECSTILSTWNPVNRYNDGSIGWDEQTSILFQSELEKCFEKVAKMVVDSAITY